MTKKLVANRPKSLNVHFNDSLIGTLTESRRKLRLKFSDEYLQHHRGSTLLSCSIRVAGGSHDPTNFLDGLLPEGDFRARLAADAGVTSADTFGLLARFGRDIAGALSIIDPERAEPRVEVSIPLDDEALRSEVEGLPSRPLGIYDDSELSIAGMQNKLLLVRDGDQWARPIGGQPSTHILKIDPQAHPGIVRAEASVMALAKAVGLTSVDVEVRTIGAIECIIVERFDRVVGPKKQVARVHQEDICQAMGLPPERKYELPGRGWSQKGGGPEFSDVAQLLDEYAIDPVADLDRLARVATFTAITGNSDAHGKNLALLHDQSGRVELAPLYDTVPTILFPRLKDEAAMTIGGAVNLAMVGKAAIRREAKHWNTNPDRMVEQSVLLCQDVLENLDTIAESGHVHQLIEERAERFLASDE